MGIKTTYTCDICGAEETEDNDVTVAQCGIFEYTEDGEETEYSMLIGDDGECWCNECIEIISSYIEKLKKKFH